MLHRAPTTDVSVGEGDPLPFTGSDNLATPLALGSGLIALGWELLRRRRYKTLENKKVATAGFEARDAAVKEIAAARERLQVNT